MSSSRRCKAVSYGQEPLGWLLLLSVVCWQAVTLTTGASVSQSSASPESSVINATEGSLMESTRVSPEVDMDQLQPRNEPACLQAGGVCVQSGSCPEGFVAHASSNFYMDLEDILGHPKEKLVAPDEELCPDQAREGVQCCYRVATSEKRCHAHGGECRSPEACGRAPKQLGVKCLNEGTICCILLF